MDGGPIDRSSPVPLYFQIAENLRAAVAEGRLRPGDRLDNELDLCARLGVSRPTVRQAIQTLVQDGMVVRRRGLGTVVAARPIQRPLALTSLYDDLVTAGRRPATRVLEVTWREADEHAAAALAVEVGAPVVSIQRLRSAGGRPLALMHNELAAHWVEGLDVEAALAERGLYGLLRRRGA
ncbi:GntR family transcriptional regulator, partial [Acidimicrobiaceae bacterium USS-CC1]|nr:GntR family transcriptional regulator [Acidiferrimicrobium australe]